MHIVLVMIGREGHDTPIVRMRRPLMGGNTFFHMAEGWVIIVTTIEESFQEKVKHVSQVGQTSDSGTKEVDAATRLKLWAKSAGGKKRGLLYGAGEMSKHYKPGVSFLTQAYGTQVATNSSVEITAQIEAVVQRANAAEEDARIAREEFQRANQRTKNLERQMKKLEQSVSCIKGDQHHRHRDYEEDDSDIMDESVDSLYD
ncbi:hypothetical protein TSUD_392820 [Trifolium subterraneum]|uniref:Uncharacterized protein n=1 Tax=Trifolium subterraneum TaxID=3900 RepID=A0A2Z6MFJ7_TRISU|nr:hypothetical protein TSUD_392820 [Trifolium subterraneum]